MGKNDVKTEETKVPQGEIKDEVPVSREEYETLLKKIEGLTNSSQEADKTAENTKRKERLEESKKLLSERVKIKLFKDGEKYKDDLLVSINGKAIKIQRGVEVEIPKAYATVIEQSQIQSIRAAEYEEQKQEEGKW